MRTSMILVQNGKKIKVPSLRVQLKFEDVDELALPRRTTDAAATRPDGTPAENGNFDSEFEQGSEEDEDEHNEDELVNRNQFSDEGPGDDEVWEGFNDEANAVVQQEPSGQGGNNTFSDSPKLRLFRSSK